MDLLYTTNSDGAGAVFAERRLAESVNRVHTALRDATTWGELAAMVSPDEYAEILDNNDLRPTDVRADEPFDAERDVAGYADGDYPTWLQRVALGWFPAELVEKYGMVGESMFHGQAVELPADQADAVASDLRALHPDWTVTRTDLFFF